VAVCVILRVSCQSVFSGVLGVMESTPVVWAGAKLKGEIVLWLQGPVRSNAVCNVFSGRYGWTREATEALLKLICEDNVWDKRKLIEKKEPSEHQQLRRRNRLQEPIRNLMARLRKRMQSSVLAPRRRRRRPSSSSKLQCLCSDGSLLQATGFVGHGHRSP
jgi:hypothetical protein